MCEMAMFNNIGSTSVKITRHVEEKTWFASPPPLYRVVEKRSTTGRTGSSCSVPILGFVLIPTDWETLVSYLRVSGDT